MERDEIDVVQLKVRMRERVRNQVERAAREAGISLSAEIVNRIEQSFANDHVIADQRSTIEALDQIVAAQREWLAFYGTNPHDVAIVRAFAGMLRIIQERRGEKWREGGRLPWAVTDALRRFMAGLTRYPLLEGLGGSTETDQADADFLVDTARSVFSPLFPPMPAPKTSTSDDAANRMRLVVTFRLKSTGEVLETVTAYEGVLGGDDSGPLSPAFVSAIAKYKARRDEIDVEETIIRIRNNDGSMWERAEKPAVYLIGQEQASAWVPAEPNRPAEIFQTSDWDGVWDDRPRDDGDGDGRGPHDDAPGTANPAGGDAAAVPASGRRRKVKAKA